MFVKVPSINVGDEIKIETINEFINDVNSVPKNINEDNVRIEGIDRRNIKNKSVQELDPQGVFRSHSSFTYEVPHTTVLSPVFESSTGRRVQTGNSNAFNGETVIVFFSCEYVFDPGTAVSDPIGANTGGPEIKFSLQFRDLQTLHHNYNQIKGTERQFNTFLSTKTDKKFSFLTGACTIVGAIQAATTTSGSNAFEIVPHVGHNYTDNNSCGALARNGSCVLKNINLYTKIVRR